MSESVSQVPVDFPKDSWPSAVSGVNPKLAVRLERGKYVAGQTDDERRERYLICQDLVEQLIGYVKRKRSADAQEPLDEFLRRVDAATRAKGWDISPVEITWIFAQLRERLRRPANGRSCHEY